jgi:hypothetical protein
LGRPVALTGPAAAVATQSIADQQLAPASFIPPLPSRLEPVAGTQNLDIPNPLPPGPLADASQAQTKPQSNPPVQKLEPPRAEPEPALDKPSSQKIAVDDCDCNSVFGDPCFSCDKGGCWSNFWQRGNCFKEANCFWASGEYLVWWIRPSNFPPLVTTGPAGPLNVLTPGRNGVLGPGTTVLFGDRETSNEERSGARVAFGLWFDDERTIGLDATIFGLAQRTVGFTGGSPGTPVLARPFFNAGLGAEDAELVAYPGLIAGTVGVSSTSQLFGADTDLRFNLWRGPCWHIDVMGGFRYLQLDESLNITENLMVPPTSVPGGALIGVKDSFSTHNNFYGGQIGTEFEFRRGRWSLDLSTKLAVGDMNEVVKINGFTSLSCASGCPAVLPGGLLALPTNIGQATNNRLAFIAEPGVKIGYNLTPRLRATVGYSLIYVSDVVRPGNQIDRVINTSQLPNAPVMFSGTPRPAGQFRTTDFWAQGISFGLEFRF